ncbi:hypothetical protein [Streptomyces sp. NPDC005407]|uniref:hypothetical protein n=1 Tax=Streptomyces sp. NPDC005407 TaxID=3155340 RepID=UPI0033A56D18
MSASEAEVTREQPTDPEAGDVVRDAATKQVGRVMGHEGPCFQLRPLNGGKEWDARREHLTPALQSDALSTAVAEANDRSRNGSLL